METTPKLLTPKAAAQTLAISPRKLWGLTAAGEIPAVRIGRAVRYDAVDLQNYIDRQKATPSEPTSGQQKGGAA